LKLIPYGSETLMQCSTVYVAVIRELKFSRDATFTSRQHRSFGFLDLVLKHTVLALVQIRTFLRDQDQCEIVHIFPDPDLGESTRCDPDPKHWVYICFKSSYLDMHRVFLLSESAVVEKAQKERGICLLVQGGERTGQPEQDRHGHLRQLQLQV
jgi:hypothetical protein